MLATDLAPEHAQMGQDLQRAKQDLPLEQLEEASFSIPCALILYVSTIHTIPVGKRSRYVCLDALLCMITRS